MDKILINIDSRQRDFDVFLNPGNFNLTLNCLDNINNKYYIKLSEIKIPNKFHFFNTLRKNNSFSIKGIFSGPPPGPDIFHLPTENIKILISENTKFDGSLNIHEFLNYLNKQLNIAKFNEYDFTNNIVKGIYFSLNDINLVTIINLSKHYNCEISFENIKLGYNLGFKNNIYNLYINSKISAESTFILFDEYIFIKINNYDNLIINDNYKVFAKLNYNNNYYSICETIDFKYILKDIEKNNFIFQLMDYYGNILDFNDNYSFILEFGLITNINNLQILDLNSTSNLNEKKKKKKDFSFDY